VELVELLGEVVLQISAVEFVIHVEFVNKVELVGEVELVNEEEFVIEVKFVDHSIDTMIVQRINIKDKQCILIQYFINF
jgi:hypothetical protein